MARDRVLPLLAWGWRQLVPERAQWRLMWLLVPKFVIGVTGIIFDNAGRVLLVRHTFRRRYPWGLVSGWVKAGEPLEAALRREVREETSFAVDVERLFDVRSDRLHLALEVVYLCRSAGGTFHANNEVTEARWCWLDDLPDGLHPHHAPLIQAAAAARCTRHRHGTPG